MFKRISGLFIIVFSSSVLCCDVVELPDNFYPYTLNDQSQSIGYIANEPMLKSTTFTQAAVWEPKKGLCLFPLTDYSSRPTVINDLGFVVVNYNVYQPLSTMPKTVLWNIFTNELKYGPVGSAWAINNRNIVVIKSNKTILWDTQNDILTFPTGNPGVYMGISDDGIFYSDVLANINGAIGINKNGKVLCSNDNVYSLFYKGKYQFISFPDNIEGKVFLNNNDEVASLTSGFKSKGERGGLYKPQYTIVIWKNGKIVRSQPLEEISQFKTYFERWSSPGFVILGFNSRRQVLLKAAKRNLNIDPKYFLLTLP